MYSPRDIRDLGDEIERHVNVPASERKATPREQLDVVIGEVDAIVKRIRAVSASIENERAAYVEKHGEDDTAALAQYAAYEQRRAEYCLSYLRFIHHMTY